MMKGKINQRNTMSIFASIAERRIQEAIQRGEFDNLTLRGQPLPREDLSAVPEDLRMGYKILKNAGYLPEELQLHREMLTLKDLLLTCNDMQDRTAIRRQLTLRQLQFDQLMERNGRNLAVQEYQPVLTARLLER
jgi:hypothetical protein